MTAIKLIVAMLVVVSAVAVSGADIGHFLTKRAILLDENFAPLADDVSLEGMAALPRQRRDSGYGPPEPHKGYKPSYTPGKVGPVYTFVKTDYNGNFKWGVRHRAGVQYAGGYH